MVYTIYIYIQYIYIYTIYIYTYITYMYIYIYNQFVQQKGIRASSLMVFLSTILMSVSMSVTPTAWGQRWRLDEVPTVGRVLPGPRSWAQTQAKLTRNHSELHAMRELTLGNARRSAKPKPNTRERVESTEALSSTQPHGQPNCQCEKN